LKKGTCPKCGGTDITMILWGLPVFDRVLEKLVDQKKVVLGGCNVTGNDPKLECSDCHHQWGEKNED